MTTRNWFWTGLIPATGLLLISVLSIDDFESGARLNSASAANTAASPRPPVAVGHPTFVSPHSTPIAVHGDDVFVVNTPSDTVDIIDTTTRRIRSRVSVGVDPVSVAVRPDGKEVWVSNHISDSVSVIDNDSSSATYLHIIATVQEIDPDTKATRFDEPVGIAFASNDKAYVAVSSENQIAVINVATREVTKKLAITAQDPRAITVRDGRLYVLPFESNNKTQLSGGRGDRIDGDLVTFDAWQHSIFNNNVLSLGHVLDIVKHPKVPDRDLYVFDTSTDELIEVVDTLGTLLYGLTVDSKGRAFIAQTDARNDVNGRSGTKKHGLKELENRAFLNQITRVTVDSGEAGKPEFIDLERLPPQHPRRGEALATPFAIQVTEDDSTLVVSAAGSDRIFTVDTATNEVLGQVTVGAVPRGIALAHNENGQASRAWVFNAVENSVSLVDVTDRQSLKVVDTIALEDPTHAAVKRGRIAFNTATASTTGTYSCASCHPDGHTDQLLWVLKTPVVTGGNQIMPRSTMPIRGLRDTEPYHWDGIPGDPYGGNNSANIHGSSPPNSRTDDPTTSTRHLIDGGLAATMMMEGDKTVNDEGKAGELSAAERDDMAVFLLSVPYPPAQRRAYDNVVSDRATQGFRLFHIDGDLDDKPRPNVCGNCHRMPFLVSTNTPGTGMDAPTWRGASDRFLILPQGRLNIIDFDFYAQVAEQGQPEKNIWQFSWAGRRRFDPVWNMVLEASTGYSGSFARQVTLNRSSANSAMTTDLLNALEVSATEGAIVLEAEGVFTGGATTGPVALQFVPTHNGGRYIEKLKTSESNTDAAERLSFNRDQLVALAVAGNFTGTFTGRHGVKADVEHPQPALWTAGPIERQRGRQEFPILYEGNNSMTISGRHIDDNASVVVDGRRISATVSPGDDDGVTVTFSRLPAVGLHLMQVQNANGLFSNDFIFHVAASAEAAVDQKRRTDEAHVDIRDAIADAISRGDLDELKSRLRRQPGRINARRPRTGSTPLGDAAFRGNLEIASYLIGRGAKIDGTNRDGNTPLHIAAFMCRTEVVRVLLDRGASTSTKNNRKETPIDVVASPWSEDLAGLYTVIANAAGLKLDLKRMRAERPRMLTLLRSHEEKTRKRKEEKRSGE